MDSGHLDKRHEKFCDDAETRSRSAAGLDRREFMAAAGATAVVAAAGLGATEAEAAFSDRVAGITQDEPMELIGTGVSAQERFFKKFEEVSGGLQVTGQVASLADSVQKWITGGYETFSMIETNAFRTPALREAETIAPIPVEKITNWEFADTLFSDPAHVGADHTSGWPVEMVYWDDTRTSFGMLPRSTTWMRWASFLTSSPRHRRIGSRRTRSGFSTRASGATWTCGARSRSRTRT